MHAVAEVATDQLRVWVDQDLCTGDGLCVQYAPEVFEFDVDGLAYVKDGDGELQLAPGSRVDVPAHLRLDVIDAAKECPGDCIHVVRAATRSRSPARTPTTEPRAGRAAGPGRTSSGYASEHRPADHRGDQPGELLQPGDLPGPAVVEGLAEAQRVVPRRTEPVSSLGRGRPRPAR